MRESTYKKKCEALFKKAKDKGVELIFSPENYSANKLNCLFCAYLLMGALSTSYSATTVITVAGFFPLLGFGVMAGYILLSKRKKAK